MSTPPEANSEYSRGSGAFGRLILPARRLRPRPAHPDPSRREACGSRLPWALLGAPLIALIGDLADASPSGLIGSSAGGYMQATSSPSAGLSEQQLDGRFRLDR